MKGREEERTETGEGGRERGRKEDGGTRDEGGQGTEFLRRGEGSLAKSAVDRKAK